MIELALAAGHYIGVETIETLRFDPDDGLWELDRHIARLGASAAAFDFHFDRHQARNALHCATFRLREAARVRMLLSPNEPVAVALIPLPVDPSDFRLRHKTSDRAFYDDARRAAGAFEVVFVREDGLVTEGSFTNVFVERDGTLVTPPVAHGLLPGILRETLIESGEAIEGQLTLADLREGFLIGNALRGLIKAHLR